MGAFLPGLAEPPAFNTRQELRDSLAHRREGDCRTIFRIILDEANVKLAAGKLLPESALPSARQDSPQRLDRPLGHASLIGLEQIPKVHMIDNTFDSR